MLISNKFKMKYRGELNLVIYIPITGLNSLTYVNTMRRFLSIPYCNGMDLIGNYYDNNLILG